MIAARLAALVALLCTALLSPPLRAAGEPDDVGSQFEAGKLHFNAGRYREAAVAFSEAYRVSPIPALLYDLAQCRRLSGDLPASRDLYRSFLQSKPDARKAAMARERLAEVEGALAVGANDDAKRRASRLRFSLAVSGDRAGVSDLRIAIQRAIVDSGFRAEEKTADGDLVVRAELDPPSMRVSDDSWTTARQTARLEIIDSEQRIVMSLSESSKAASTNPAEAQRRARVDLLALLEGHFAAELHRVFKHQ